MQKYFLDVLINHYADFKGKATRTQYWLWVVWTMVIGILFFVLGLFIPVLQIPLRIIQWGALFVPSIAIIVRRLRDGGFSPYLVLLTIPYYIYSVIVNIIVLFPNNNILENPNPIFAIAFSGFVLISALLSLVILILMCLPSKQTQPEQLN